MHSLAVRFRWFRWLWACWENDATTTSDMQELLTGELQTFGVDTASIPGRIHIPQGCSFSQALTQIWMRVNTKFHVSSKYILWTWSSPERLGKNPLQLMDVIVELSQ